MAGLMLFVWFFAQNEAGCVVFDMQKGAIAAGAVDEVVPLKDMTKAVLSKLA